MNYTPLEEVTKAYLDVFKRNINITNYACWYVDRISRNSLFITYTDNMFFIDSDDYTFVKFTIKDPTSFFLGLIQLGERLEVSHDW